MACYSVFEAYKAMSDENLKNFLKWIDSAYPSGSAERKLVTKGGGNRGGHLTKEFNNRVLPILITEDLLLALEACFPEKSVADRIRGILFWKGNCPEHTFISTKNGSVADKRARGQHGHREHNPPNKYVTSEYLSSNSQPFEEQTYDLITIEEDEALRKAGLAHSGTHAQRDAVMSHKVNITTLGITEQEVTNYFHCLPA